MFKEIGGRIKYLLKINNMKAADLALHIGVSQAAISRLISANRIPKIKGKNILYDIASYLGDPEGPTWIETGYIDWHKCEHECEQCQHDYEHECEYKFKNDKDVCPSCGYQVSDYILPKIRLRIEDVSSNLMGKLVLIKQYSQFLKSINDGVLKNLKLDASSFENLELLENTLKLKERTIDSLVRIKLECEELIENEKQEKVWGRLDLNDYLEEHHWEDDFSSEPRPPWVTDHLNGDFY